MSIHKYYCFVILFGLLAGANSEALSQNRSKVFSVGLMPMNFFTGSAKGEVEFTGGKQNHAFALTPQYYFAYLGDGNNYFGEGNTYNFFGYGSDFQHKIFLNKAVDSASLYDWRAYFGYGLGYQRFVNKYRADAWYSYEDNGLTYYTIGRRNLTDEITRLRFFISTGVQKRSEFAVFEAYTGMGYQSSTIDTVNPELIQYERGFWNYAYSGLMVRMGFKIGIYIF